MLNLPATVSREDIITLLLSEKILSLAGIVPVVVLARSHVRLQEQVRDTRKCYRCRQAIYVLC